MEMGIVPKDGARRTATPVVAVLRCRTVPRASAQKTDIQRLVVHVETRQNDAVPHNKPTTYTVLIPKRWDATDLLPKMLDESCSGLTRAIG